MLRALLDLFGMGKKSKRRALRAQQLAFVKSQQIKNKLAKMMKEIEETSTSIAEGTSEVVRVNQSIRKNYPKEYSTTLLPAKKGKSRPALSIVK